MWITPCFFPEVVRLERATRLPSPIDGIEGAVTLERGLPGLCKLPGRRQLSPLWPGFYAQRYYFQVQVSNFIEQPKQRCLVRHTTADHDLTVFERLYGKTFKPAQPATIQVIFKPDLAIELRISIRIGVTHNFPPVPLSFIE
jgi:hypothetical protein